jgi:hypothetical protein
VEHAVNADNLKPPTPDARHVVSEILQSEALAAIRERDALRLRIAELEKRPEPKHIRITRNQDPADGVRDQLDALIAIANELAGIREEINLAAYFDGANIPLILTHIDEKLQAL